MSMCCVCCIMPPAVAVAALTETCIHAVVDAQNKLTQSLFSKCKSRTQFKDLFRQLYDYEKFGCPSKRGSRCVDCFTLKTLPACLGCCSQALNKPAAECDRCFE